MRAGWVKVEAGVYHHCRAIGAMGCMVYFHPNPQRLNDRAGWYYQLTEPLNYHSTHGPYPTMQAAMESAEKEMKKGENEK